MMKILLLVGVLLIKLVMVKKIIDSTDFIMKNKLPIKKIISSDLKRAVATSEIVNKKLQVPIFYSDKIRELDKCIYTGLLKSTLTEKDVYFIKNLTIYDKYPNNSCRRESVDLAIKLDNLIYKAWYNHNNLVKIKCYDNLYDTQNEIISAIDKELNNKKLERVIL